MSSLVRDTGFLDDNATVDTVESGCITDGEANEAGMIEVKHSRSK